MIAVTSGCDWRHSRKFLVSEIENCSSRGWIIRHPRAKAESSGDLLHGEVVRQDFRIDTAQFLVSSDLYDTTEEFHSKALILARIRYQHSNFPFVFGVCFHQ